MTQQRTTHACALEVEQVRRAIERLAPEAHLLEPLPPRGVPLLVVLALAQYTSLFSFILDDDSLETRNMLRHEWRLEQDAHAREEARWNHDRAVHLREMHAWKHELETLQEKRDQWIREVETERAQWAFEHRKEELRRKEIERKRQGVHWSEAWGSNNCAAYGTRSYNAHLLDIPAELNWYEVCADMPKKFHGLWVDKPANCQHDVSSPGRMYVRI